MYIIFNNPWGVTFLGAVAIFSIVSLAPIMKLMRTKPQQRDGSDKSDKESSQCSIKECAALFGRVIEDCRAISMSLCDKVESKKGELQGLLAQIENEKASALSLIEKAKKAKQALNSVVKASAAASNAASEAERYTEARRLIKSGADPEEVSRQLAIAKCELALLLETKTS